MCVCVRVYVRACVCVCVRERDREKERACVNLCIETNSIYDQTHQLTQMHILLSLQNYPCGPLSLPLPPSPPLSSKPCASQNFLHPGFGTGAGWAGRVGSGVRNACKRVKTHWPTIYWVRQLLIYLSIWAEMSVCLTFFLTNWNQIFIYFFPSRSFLSLISPLFYLPVSVTVAGLEP